MGHVAIQFAGAAESVTGATFLITCDGNPPHWMRFEFSFVIGTAGTFGYRKWGTVDVS